MGTRTLPRVYLIHFLIAFGWTISFNAVGQLDSIKWEVEVGTLMSTEEVLPLYLHSNVGGVYDYDFSGVYTRGKLEGNFLKREKSRFNYGLDIYMMDQAPLVNFQQAYLEYNRGPITLMGGLQEIGLTEMEQISFGKFGITNNARPIPKIGIFMHDYWKLPVLKGLVAVKGELFQGWLEKDRYIENPWLHGKSLYIKLGNDKFSFAGGLNHYVVWAGTFVPTNDDLPDDWNAFWKVFTGQGLDNVAGGEENGLGNHLGFWEFTIEVKIGDAVLELNNQNPYEDGKSWRFWSVDDFNDFLWGMRLDLKEKSFLGISKVSLDYFSTTDQGGPGLPDELPEGVNNFGYGFGGRDDTYNNWLYRDGWTYQDRVIGNPLFIDRALGQFYFDVVKDYGVAIINNRIRALHLGLSGQIKTVEFKLMTTVSKNFGTYAGLYEGRFKWEGIQTDPDFEYIFKEPLYQTYMLLELRNRPFKRNQNIDLILKLALDRGEITNNFGAHLAVSYSGLVNRFKKPK